MAFLPTPFMNIFTVISISISIIIGIDQWRSGRSDLKIPDFGAPEESLQLYRTGQGGRKRYRATETVQLAPMAFHALRTDSKVLTCRRCAAVAGEDWKGIDRWRTWSGQGDMLRLEKVKMSYGRQQTLSVAAIDFVSKQVALKGIFLNSVLALAAD